MAHAQQQAFIAGVKNMFPASFVGTKVLEVGSYNVNGSVRQFFESPTLYIGLDLAPGRDVDVVCHGADYHSHTLFDVVISTECFEHDIRWEETFDNMVNLCKPGGLVVFTCAAHHRQEHGTLRTSPADSAIATTYYKNLNVINFERAFMLRELFGWYGWEARDHDLFFFGVKR